MQSPRNCINNEWPILNFINDPPSKGLFQEQKKVLISENNTNINAEMYPHYYLRLICKWMWIDSRLTKKKKRKAIFRLESHFLLFHCMTLMDKLHAAINPAISSSMGDLSLLTWPDVFFSLVCVCVCVSERDEPIIMDITDSKIKIFHYNVMDTRTHTYQYRNTQTSRAK